MILKILPRHSAGAISSLLRYIQNHGKSKDGKVHQILHNVRSKDLPGQIQEYLTNEAHRKTFRKDGVFVRHEILSFSPSSNVHLSNEILEDIAKHYLHIRGANCQAVGAIHNQGKDHYHIHLCVSGIDLVRGRSTHIPRPDLHRIKSDLQRYYLEKYPELEQSAVRHGIGESYLSQKEYQLKLRSQRLLKKEELERMVKSCFDRSTNQTEFLEHLLSEGIPHYERNGKTQGVIFKDMKFRFSQMPISLSELPLDKTQEERNLDEIRKLREKRDQRNPTKERER